MPNSITTLIVFAAVSVTARTAMTQETANSLRIDVVANDYTFLPLPKRIAPGPTIFTFVNQGKVQHEMAIGRLKPGVSIEDVVKVSKEGGRRRELIARSVGILIAGPGESPDGRLWVDLVPGQTYVVFCALRDTPDAQPHLLMGMYAAFRPQ